MVGVYTERLPHFNKGTLHVSNTSWYIQFYFSGPDLRYNGTFFTINSAEVDSYIEAYRINWQKYLELKKTTPAEGSYQTSGSKNMRIGVGGFAEGVCLTSYKMPIRNESELNNIINDLEWAKKKATSIMSASILFSPSPNASGQTNPDRPKDNLQEKKTAVLKLIETLKSYSLSKEKQKKKPDLKKIPNPAAIHDEPSATVEELKAEILQLKAEKQNFENLIVSSFKRIEMQQKAEIKKVEDNLNLYIHETLKEFKNDLQDSIGSMLKKLEDHVESVKILQEKLHFDLTNEPKEKNKDGLIKRVFSK